MANPESQQPTLPAAAPASTTPGDQVDLSSMVDSGDVRNSTNTETAVKMSDTDTRMADVPPTAPESPSASQGPTANTTAATTTSTNDKAGQNKEEEEEPVLFEASGDYDLLLLSTNQWGRLLLRIDQIGGRLWGRFTIGSMDGAIRADNIDNLEYGESVSFLWRYIDKEAGVIKFGPTRTGALQGVDWNLDTHGGIKGEFLGLVTDGQTLEFEGIHTGEEARHVDDLAAHWRNIAQKAFLQS